MPTPHHALVLGASGTAGWGVVDSLLRNYPHPNTYSQVTAVTNRPLDPSTTLWPTGPSHPTLSLVSGIDLTAPDASSVIAELRAKVPSISTVTHVFYFAYKECAVEFGGEFERETNVRMLENVVEAVEVLAPGFSALVYPGGAKAYGVHCGGGFYEAPFAEDVPRLPSPQGDCVNYYAFRDLLNARSAGKRWTWSEICPDAVIGYTPNGSQFSLVALWGNYLSLYAAVNGKGAKVHFPGNRGCWESLFNESSSEIIGKQSIWAAANPDKSAGQVFNVACRAEPHNWADNWPKLAAYFGLEGVRPVEGASMQSGPWPGRFVWENRHLLEERGVRANEVVRSDFLDMYGYYMDYDRQFSLAKIREAGFADEEEPLEAWFRTWDNFKKTGLMMD